MRFTTLSLGLALTFSFVGCYLEPASEKTNTTPTQEGASETEPSWSDYPEMEFVSLSIDGMTCSGCVSEVTEKLNDVDSVNACQVNLDAKTAKVQVKKGTTADQLVGAFEGTRFQVTVADQ